MAFNVQYVIEAIDRFSPIINKIKSSQVSLAASQSKMAAQTHAASAAINGLSAQSISSAANVTNLAKSAESVGSAFSRSGAAVTGFTSRVKTATAASMAAAQKINILGTGLAAVPFLATGRAALMQASNYETSTATFETMLGSVEAAKKRMDELLQLAATTPFEQADVIDLGKSLQAIGRYSKENVINLGDLAAASGKPIQQVTGAFQKLASGQKGIAVDMFRDLLITTDDWVKATGKGISKSGELKASTEEMLKALPKILANKNFVGLMDRQSKTMAGIFSNFKDSINLMLLDFGQAFIDAFNVKENLKSFTDFLAKVKEEFKVLSPEGKKFATGLFATLTALPVLITALGITAKLLNPLGSGFSLAFKGIKLFGGAAIWTAKTAIPALYQGTMLLATKAIPALAKSFVTLGRAMFANPLGLVIAAIAAVAAGFYFLFTKTEMGRRALKNIGEALGKLVLLFSQGWNYISESVRTNTGFIGKYINGVISVYSAAWQTAQTLASGFVEAFTWAKDGIVGAFDIINQKIMSFVDGLRGAYDEVVRFLQSVGILSEQKINVGLNMKQPMAMPEFNPTVPNLNPIMQTSAPIKPLVLPNAQASPAQNFNNKIEVSVRAAPGTEVAGVKSKVEGNTSVKLGKGGGQNMPAIAY